MIFFVYNNVYKSYGPVTKAAKEKGLQLVWALSLPGKVAPTTTAEFIKDTIYNILKEIYK